MKLSRMIERLLSEVPNIGATGSGATSEQLTALLNEGAEDVNRRTKLLSGHTDFNVSANVGIYAVSQVIPTFNGLNKMGAYFKDDNGKWQKIYPKTKAWIMSVYPDWINAASTHMPRWYWQEKNEFGLFQPPDASQSQGCRVYHFKTINLMVTNDDYPFTGSSGHVAMYDELDDAVLAYAKWKLAPAFGKMTDIDVRRREYRDELRKGAKKLNMRPDLTIDAGYSLRT